MAETMLPMAFLGLLAFANGQGRNEGARGAQCPGRQITLGGAEKSNSVASTSFNTVHLLPKDLRFEHGGAKLLAPGANLPR